MVDFGMTVLNCQIKICSEWLIYAENDNNKMLTSSSDNHKVASGCLLVYGNVFTVSIPFQEINHVCDRKFINPNGCVY